MADRTVKVKLTADVSAYVRDVAVATAATRALRAEAERFEKRYVATLRVNDEASGPIRRAEQQSARSAARMRADLNRSGKQVSDRLRGLKAELADLERNGVDLRFAADSDALKRDISRVKGNLASLNNQAITIPVAVEITKGNIELAQLEDRLKRLDRSTYEPEVRLRADRLRKDIASARAELMDLRRQRVDISPGSFAAGLRKQLEGALRSLPDLELRADATPAEREIAKIRAELLTLSDKRIGVDIDDASALAEARALRMRLERVLGGTISARLRADAGDAAAQLSKLEAAASGASTTMDKASRSTDRFNKGLLGTVRNAAGTAQALKTLVLPPALLAAGPTIASLTGSLVTMSGALAALPALGFAAAAGFGAIAIGLKNWGEFTKQLAKGKMDKAAIEAAKMAPAAKAAATELIKLADAYDKAASVVQEALFKGATKEIRDLAKDYLPLVKTGLGGVAGELNTAAVAFSNFATQADTLRDTKDGLKQIQLASIPLAGTIVNLSAIFRDMGAVGARFLPGLSRGVEGVTERLRTTIAVARADGELSGWIRKGAAEARQLGDVLGNTVGILSGLGRASQDAGLDTLGWLDRLTASAHRYIDSWQGQARVRETLAGLAADARTFVPGLQDLAGAAADFVGHLSSGGVISQLGQTFSSLVDAARPVTSVIGQLVATALKPLLATIQAISPLLGPALAGMLALRTGSAIIGKVQGGLATLGDRFDNAARAASGNAAATSKVSGALTKVSGALPLIGVALLAAAGAYEYLRDRSSEAVASMLSGSQTMQASLQQEYEAIGRRRVALEPGVALTAIWGSAQEKAALATDTAKQALAENNAEIERQIQAMPPLQAASARVTLAQQNLNAAIDANTISSPQARLAQEQLTAATNNLELEQIAAANGTDKHTAAVLRQRDQMLGAIDAEIAYKASIDTASQSIAENGKTTDLNTAQGRANMTALQDLSRTAYADIEAKKKQGAETGVVTALGKNHQDQLYRTAIQMGLSKDEAGRYVAQLGLVPESQETRFFTTGLPEAIRGVGDLARVLGSLQGDASITLSGAVGDAITAAKKRTGRAMGGPLRGPGTGTSDSIPLYGSNGEWVIRERVTREQGDQKMALLNSGMGTVVPKGAVPRRASGGPITTDVRLDFTKIAEEAKAKQNEIFPPYTAGGGAQQWAGVAAQALAMLGQPASLLPRVLQQIQIESSGNPRSINLWDINARRGTPSKGLIQTIDSTYRANADPRRDLGPYDPLSNLLAGIRYAIRRYGSIAAIWPTKGGYHDGGTIPGAGGGDNKMVMAQSGERVLTRPQNTAFERLVSVLDRPTPVSPYLAAGVRGGDGPSAHVEIHNENHFREAVDLDLFNQRQDFAVRSSTF